MFYVSSYVVLLDNMFSKIVLGFMLEISSFILLLHYLGKEKAEKLHHYT